MQLGSMKAQLYWGIYYHTECGTRFMLNPRNSETWTSAAYKIEETLKKTWIYNHDFKFPT